MPGLDPSSQRVRLFKSDRLEKLTMISPRTFVLTWALLLPLVVWMGWGSADLSEALALLASGFVAWTLFEYAMHRYLFHLEREESHVQWFVFLIHGNHHASPNDPLRDLMPLSVSLPVLALVWAGCFALCGSAGTWLFLGFTIGYVIYDTIHYACHQWPMRGKLGAALKRHHMRHHYVDESSNFGISSMLWDRVFGTCLKAIRQR